MVRLLLTNKLFRHIAKQKRSKGQSLVELLVIIGISGVVLPALIGGFIISKTGKANESQRLAAVANVKELAEATRSIREDSWNKISVSGTYRPIISGTGWALATGSDTVNGLTRSIVISDVYRNNSGTIVASGGTLDPATKKVVYNVSWSTPLPQSVSHTEYLQRYIGNTSFVDDDVNDFASGTKTNVSPRNVLGGELVLGKDSGSSWRLPFVAGTFNGTGTTDFNDIFVSGSFAYVVGNSLRILSLSGTAMSSTGNINITGTQNAVYIQGNFAYVASTGDSNEVNIVNVSNKSSPTVSGTLNLTGSADATDIFVSGSYAYVGRMENSASPEYAIVNITNPTSPSLSGSLEIGADIASVYTSGTNGYVLNDSGSSELRVINVNNKASPSSLSSTDISGSGTYDYCCEGEVVAVGNTVFVGGFGAYNAAGLSIYNMSNPASPSLYGSLKTNGAVESIGVLGSTVIMALERDTSDVYTEKVMTVDISSITKPAEFGYDELDSYEIYTALAISGSNAYFTSTDDNHEVVLVTPGQYKSPGTYTSNTFDAGTGAAYNYLDFVISEPSATDLKFQIATNNDNSSWSYVGPDGTASTYYETRGGIPISKVSGRYFRYRSNFTTTNVSYTPIIYSVTINYSP